jgi:hypothetical protein
LLPLWIGGVCSASLRRMCPSPAKQASPLESGSKLPHSIKTPKQAPSCAPTDFVIEDRESDDLFGDNEFKIRALAYRIAAKAIEQHLARKKTDMREPV